jgi:hypothetical protein
LSCRIEPSLIDPHFQKPAGDLRYLSRTNREEGQRITDEGGKKVQQLYFKPCHWIATLNLTADELFGGGDSPVSERTPEERLADVFHPILLLDQPEHIG